MAVALIWMRFKPDLLLVEGTIDAGRYNQNLYELNCISALDKRPGHLG
jgi:hypothetical protein